VFDKFKSVNVIYLVTLMNMSDNHVLPYIIGIIKELLGKSQIQSIPDIRRVYLPNRKRLASSCSLSCPILIKGWTI